MAPLHAASTAMTMMAMPRPPDESSLEPPSSLTAAVVPSPVGSLSSALNFPWPVFVGDREAVLAGGWEDGGLLAFPLPLPAAFTVRALVRVVTVVAETLRGCTVDEGDARLAAVRVIAWGAVAVVATAAMVVVVVVVVEVMFVVVVVVVVEVKEILR